MFLKPICRYLSYFYVSLFSIVIYATLNISTSLFMYIHILNVYIMFKSPCLNTFSSLKIFNYDLRMSSCPFPAGTYFNPFSQYIKYSFREYDLFSNKRNTLYWREEEKIYVEINWVDHYICVQYNIILECFQVFVTE